MQSQQNPLLAGLWRQNPLLAQCLGMCPLLAVSTSLVQALILGLATCAVLVGSNTLVALSARKLPPALQLQAAMALIATLVTVVDLVLAAYWHRVYLSIGIFIPLIISNCLLLGRAEACAKRSGIGAAAWDGLAFGLGFAWVLALLAALRELLSYGDWSLSLSLLFDQLSPSQPLQLLSLLPAGVFFLLALLVAGYGWLQRRAAGEPLERQQRVIARA